jgi:hypothetical protein
MVIVDSDTPDPRSVQFMDFFRKRVIGQPNAESLAQMVFERRNSKLRNMRRPIAVVVAVGPSRTGKSYTGQVMAEFEHGDIGACTEIEGADYTEKHQMQDLKGAPPSYIGGLSRKEKKELKPEDEDPRSKISNHNLRRVRLHSKSEVNVVIINEFEKAHEDFYTFWMGIFDKGYTVICDNERVDFSNTIFVLTMNLGTDEVEKLEDDGIGFIKKGHKASSKEIKDIVDKAMKKKYKKEFRNRLDAVAIYKLHTQDELYKIVDTELVRIRTRMTDQLEAKELFELEVTDTAKQFLLDRSMADGGSVAELSRIIEKELVTRVDRLRGRSAIAFGDRVVVFCEEGGTKLATGIVKGGGDIAEVDRMAQRGENHSTGTAADFQRDLHAARKEQQNADGLDFYGITVWSRTEKQLMADAGTLQRDLLKLYELKPVTYSLQMVAPFMVCLTVRTSAEMVRLIQGKFPKATIAKIERKPVTQS